jgi:5-methyltetrahydrofolate--homocysteine methyltransferase
MSDLNALFNAIVEMQENEALEVTKQLLNKGTPALEIFNCYQKSLEEIGSRFEKQIYFIPELIMSGGMMQAGAEILKPYLESETTSKDEGTEKKIGKMLIATVEGDIHDIGKNIATMLMGLNGIDVKDMGVDVKADKIIEEAVAFKADVIGLSGLLTLAFDPMKEVVEKLKEKGLREKIKVIIGGGQMDAQVCDYVGADAFVNDAVLGVKQVKEWLS